MSEGQDVLSWVVTECTPRIDPEEMLYSPHFALCMLFLILRVVFLHNINFGSPEFSK
jgi:hypothetical protein